MPLILERQGDTIDKNTNRSAQQSKMATDVARKEGIDYANATKVER